jgi:6-pyruvoyltetrahydropterin/6-carboxytetrahydropterin synthase
VGTVSQGKVRVVRRFDFSSSHRYYRAEWSEERNFQEFGLCALPNGHGHNYILEVTIIGSPDPLTGMVINLVDMKDAVNSVLSEFDHHNLNLDTPYFIDGVPTTENFVLVLWQLIGSALPDWTLDRLRLYESEDLFVEYVGVPI